MFSKQSKSDFTSQDFHKIIQNYTAQQDLVLRQLQEGSITKTEGATELQRISRLMSAYRNNMMSAIEEEQRSDYSPK